MNRWLCRLGLVGLGLTLIGCGTAVGAAKSVGSGVSTGVSKLFGLERGVSKEQLKSPADEIKPTPVAPPPAPAASGTTTERFGLVVDEKARRAPASPEVKAEPQPPRQGMKAPFPLWSASHATSRRVAPRGTVQRIAYMSSGSRSQAIIRPSTDKRSPASSAIGPEGACSPGIHFG